MLVMTKSKVASPKLLEWNLKQKDICSATATAAAKSLQSCPTLCDPIDSSPPGSPIPGILQARTLEWVAISFSNAWKWKVKVKSLRRVRPSATPWTAAFQAPPSMRFSRQEYWSGMPLPSPTFAHFLSIDTLTFQEFLKTIDAHVLSCVWLFSSLNAAHQVPLSMGFSRQEYWSELPFPPPGDLPDTEIEPVSPASPAFASGFFHHWASWEVEDSDFSCKN